MEIAKLFDSNFVYFAVYFTVMASIGQYVLWKKVSTFLSNVHRAFVSAKKVVAKQQRQPSRSRSVAVVEQVQDAEPVMLVPDVKFKVNQKECQRHLDYIRQQRAVDAGMHNLTSKFNKPKVKV